MQPITATKAIYIKLGGGSDWADDCVKNGYIKLGYIEVDHELCSQGLWEELKADFPYGNNPGAKTRHINQVQKFYEEPESTLWIMFHGGAMYWCFSKPEITIHPDNTKTRPVLSGWSKTSITGSELITGRLSGKLLATQSFQGTICDVRELNYLLHKINGTMEPHVAKAEDAMEVLIEATIPIIKNLHPDDVEILTDLIFRQAGGQRTGVTGGTLKDIDLDLISPLTNERVAVQVKSTANRGVYNACKNQFEQLAGFSRYYFVTHSPSDDLLKRVEIDDKDDQIIFWNARTLGEYSVKNGLVGWLINKAT